MSDSIAAVSEILSQAETEPTAEHTDTVQQVSDLLTGNDPETEQVAAPDGDVEAVEGAPEAEESSGVDYDQEVPMTDGSKVKLGELKDYYQQYQSKQLEFQERENALMTKQQQIEELSNFVQLPKHLMERIKADQQQYLEQQHYLMLEAMPELRDKVAFTQAKEAIFDMAKEYGVQDIIGRVSDHGVVKMLNDFVKLRSGIKAAKGAVKPIRAAEPQSKKAPLGKPDAFTQAAEKAKQTGNRHDQVAAISALFRS